MAKLWFDTLFLYVSLSVCCIISTKVSIAAAGARNPIKTQISIYSKLISFNDFLQVLVVGMVRRFKNVGLLLAGKLRDFYLIVGNKTCLRLVTPGVCCVYY